ncbi:MAG: FMN-binding negative transcriptional regulator, partial [Spirochaetota bacterium]
MYIPPNMEMPEKPEEDVIADFISCFGFGLLVSPSLAATHIPLIYEAQDNGKGVLYGHLARANSQWRGLENQRVLVVFSGPHSYISPYWYAGKPAVPTWNYAAVHCYGRAKLLVDPADVLDELLRKYEPRLL